MARSLRFRELETRLSNLRKNLLPKTFSPTGVYSDRQLDRARSYKLLCHAEIESFLEEIAVSKLREKVRAWKRSKAPSDLIICLLCCYHLGWEYDDETSTSNIPKIKVKDKVEEIIDLAITQYNHIIQNNHGLKVKNIKQLFLPLGVRLNELDPFWLTDMDQFGTQRGLVAHNAISMHQVIDPKSEYQMVKNLLVGLKKLDALVSKIN